MQKPKRAYEITLKATGDSWDIAKQNLLKSVEHLSERGQDADMVRGGIDGSFCVLLHVDPSITPELYRQQLELFLNDRRATRHG